MPAFNHDPFDDDDALDRLLAQARWPEPDAPRIERLRALWRRLNRTPGLIRGPRFALAAVAAGLLVATGAASWRWAISPATFDEPSVNVPSTIASSKSENSNRGFSAAPSRKATNAVEAASHLDGASPAEAAIDTDLSWIRAPNRYEQVLLHADRAGSRAANNRQGAAAPPVAIAKSAPAKQKPASGQGRQAGLLSCADEELMVEYLAAIERGDRAALAAAAEVEHPPLDLLFDCLEGPVVERRLAAALVLGRIRRDDVSWRLRQYVVENVSRQEALVGLLARGDEAARATVDQARDDTQLAAVVNAAQWQLESLNTELWR